MLLRDQQIAEMLKSNPPLASDVRTRSDPEESQVQPSSLDLSVGRVFLPEVDPWQSGGADRPLSEHLLGPGATAVVETHETLHVPSNIAGIGFPPDSVSSRGLLM